jgi:hypothetical protein
MIFECCAALWVAVAVGGMPVDVNSGQSEATSLKLDVVPEGLNLSWNDTEDLVKGSLTPPQLREGEPATLTVNVASYQGAAFDGPVTLSLRPLEALGGADAQTISRRKGDKLWVATFVPHTTGPHRLEVSFRTTRFKVARAQVTVGGGRLPQWLLFALGGGLIVVAVALGAWLVLRRGATS